ncbi:enoyl-CoA hydratase [Desulfallas sp. Bu1-1]|uniref:enoyl-CoA hydratase/isomerase family protein n=1 Tax=Desulfallas sp. Bu1-1 TaxID=2787620 RepID=UPI0018A00877|nr:enoyl-CoA hydratase [Desulfallas sp. Bu1-1]MBF7084313.1 enoyl-CoA hydratase [Desulfallas sp. Bu1-1]
MTDAVLMEKLEDGVCRIVLNQPDSLNTLSDAMVEGLKLAFEQAAADSKVKVVVLTGAGRAFCAGGDLNIIDGSMGLMAAREYVFKVAELTRLIFHIEKPVIAAINGFSMGGGLVIALAADILIASSAAKFGLAFVNVGLIPDIGGTYLVPRAIGIQKAKELVFTGQMIDAYEAERIGMITKVVEPDKLDETVNQLASQIARGPSIAIGLAKYMLNRNLNRSLDEAIEDEAFAQSICMQTKDHREAVIAFKEKRKPKFSGA